MSEVRLVDNFVHLRQYEKDDAAAVFEAVRESVRELKLWLEWAHDDYSIDETKAWLRAQEDWWRSREVYNFAILDPDTQTFLGGCLLNHINHKTALPIFPIGFAVGGRAQVRRLPRHDSLRPMASRI